MFFLGPSLSCGTGGTRPSCSQGAGRISLTSEEDGDHSCHPGTVVTSWPWWGCPRPPWRHFRESTSPAPCQRRGRSAPCVLLTGSQDAWPHILFSAVWVFVLAEPGSRS